MLKSLIILPNGAEISAGVGQTNNIRSTALTECVNSGEELTLGSTCSSMMEAAIQTPRGGLELSAGYEVTFYKVDDVGTRYKVGVFTLEKPTRPSANLMKLIGYDRAAKLDKDLTVWLKNLTGWPYTLINFAGMVCEACGLELVTESVPNGDYLVTEFSKTKITGRQLMQWIGEVCCRFCRANADGKIELAWYTPAGVSITPSGDSYYFQNGLTFEDYQVASINAVQMKLADSDDGYLWPEAAEGANSYIISGNPLLNRVTEDMLPVLQTIQNELAGVSYTPCKVSIPSTMKIHAGNTVQIIDKNGVTITAYVMTKTQKGQRDTLVCTGSPRRDSSTAVNNKTNAERMKELEGYADESVKNALDAQTQKEIFDKLTNGGKEQGVYLKDGKLYLNGTYMDMGIVVASLIQTGVLQSKDGKTFVLDLDNNTLKAMFTELSISGKTVDQIAQEKAADAESKAKAAASAELSDYAATVTADISNLQSQIDGSITTWFGSYVPSGSNSPASGWTTAALKNQHLGDLFYIVDNNTYGGLVYRWALINGSYTWQLVEDVEVAKALQQAAEAKDTADGKRRVFVAQPTPPYDVGDLWAQGEGGDLLRCKTAKAEGKNYSVSDWVKASKYTDDSALNSFISGEYADDLEQVREQIDAKVETWYQQNDPSATWSTAALRAAHIGDLWHKTTDNSTWRWNGSNWVEQQAPQAVFDAIDGKASIFVEQPTPPYAVGDLWAQGSSGDLMRCIKARSSGSYVASDWGLASKYIDEETAGSIAQGKVDEQTQTDIFNKLTNNGAIQGLFMKNGQMYINTAYLAAGIIASADGTVQIDLLNNTVTVKTTVGDSPGKLVLSADGLQGYGWDYSSNAYVRTLLLTMGNNGGEVDGVTYPDVLTAITSGSGSGGLSIAPGKANSRFLLGQLRAETVLRGSTVLIDGTDVSVNPGKHLLYSGTCSVGGTCEVPGTDMYDLFAIKLGTSSETYDTTVLGYKSGNVIHGIGGYSGSSEESKKLSYVTISYTGNVWTLVDACRHYINRSGSVGAAAALSIKEIRGVI